MATEPFDFSTAAGHRLSGRLELPEAPPRGWALFAHCFSCGKDNRAAVHISRGLAHQGIGTLRFDFSGLGASEGEFGTGFSADLSDLVSAAQAMQQAGRAPALLVGHSLGGAAVLAAAAALPSVRAVATIAAPFEVAHVLHQFDPDGLAAIRRDGVAGVTLAGRPFRVAKTFLEDLAQPDQPVRIAGLHRPLLVLHAPRDETVGIDNATRIFATARHPKSFVSLDTADHLLSTPADADYAASVIGAWSARYL